jgi:hypothetical protein
VLNSALGFVALGPADARQGACFKESRDSRTQASAPGEPVTGSERKSDDLTEQPPRPRGVLDRMKALLAAAERADTPPASRPGALVLLYCICDLEKPKALSLLSTAIQYWQYRFTVYF